MKDKKLTRADLSKDQAAVYESILDWTSGFRGRDALTGVLGRAPTKKQLTLFDNVSSSILTCGGFAGTGKSTLIGVLANELKGLVAYVAYTGRAASILHRKLKAQGARTTTLTRPKSPKFSNPKWHDPTLSETSGPSFVGTIHRLLYAPIINARGELLGWQRREELDRKYRLVIVDEASMVSDEILVDMERHNIPLLAVGDHGQLPPVAASGALMQSPDLRLEKIHRQAEKNPIIKLSKIVRETGRLDYKLADKKHIRFASKGQTENVLADAYEQFDPIQVGLMCWTNRRRIQLNGTARRVLKFKGTPGKGELVLCLKNDAPIYNGMRGVLTSNGVLGSDASLKAGVKPVAVGQMPWILSTMVEFPEEGIPSTPINMCAATFNRERLFGSLDELKSIGIDVEHMGDAGHPYDFGYCLTVHKSQGSQFQHAILYLDRPVEPDSQDWRRFAYTAVTRAQTKLTVLT